MALTTQQVRQVSASWADIVFNRSGGTVTFNLDDIATGVTQIDSAVTVTGTTINGLSGITGPMSGMTTRQTSIMLALVLQVRTGI